MQRFSLPNPGLCHRHEKPVKIEEWRHRSQRMTSSHYLFFDCSKFWIECFKNVPKISLFLYCAFKLAQRYIADPAHKQPLWRHTVTRYYVTHRFEMVAMAGVMSRSVKYKILVCVFSDTFPVKIKYLWIVVHFVASLWNLRLRGGLFRETGDFRDKVGDPRHREGGRFMIGEGESLQEVTHEWVQFNKAVVTHEWVLTCSWFRGRRNLARVNSGSGKQKIMSRVFQPLMRNKLTCSEKYSKWLLQVFFILTSWQVLDSANPK